MRRRGTSETLVSARSSFLLALGIVLVFGLRAALCSTPMQRGIDQHAYLFQAKVLADTGGRMWTPRDPLTGDVDRFQFVGRQFISADIGTDRERYTAKYPLGLPLVLAVVLALAGDDSRDAVYAVAPVAVCLGLLVSFLAARMLVGSSWALLVLALLAASPVLALRSIDAGSHGVSFLLTSTTVWLGLVWRRRPSSWTAAAAGLSCGISATVRYTDILTLIPLGACMLLAGRARPERQRALLHAGLAALLAALPLALLLLSNQRSLGRLTGYVPRDGDSDFGLAHVVDNLSQHAALLTLDAVPLLFALGIAGILVAMWRRSETGWILGAWALPAHALHLPYKWVVARYFTPTLLPVAIGAAWLSAALVERVRLANSGPVRAPRWRIARVLVLVLWVTAIALGAYRGTVQCRARAAELRVHFTRILAALERVGADERTALFCAEPATAHCLQPAGDWKVYDLQLFRGDAPRATLDADPARQPALQALHRSLLDASPGQQLSRLIRRLSDGGLRVYLVQDEPLPALDADLGLVDAMTGAPVASTGRMARNRMRLLEVVQRSPRAVRVAKRTSGD